MGATAGGGDNTWIEEQAAEYADLVGSFVESVVDSDTDEIIEYQLIWEGGDLGVALTTMEGHETGVGVSRVTGKGFPFGIKNVGPGDVLLSINLQDTTVMTLDQVVSFLQVCDLPATLRFKKLSPDTSNAPISVPRKSTYVITSSNPTGPTSPQGSSAPASMPRGSTKYVPPPPVPHPMPQSIPAPSKVQPQPQGVPKQARSSMPPNKIPSDFPPPPPQPERASAFAAIPKSAPRAPAPQPPQQQHYDQRESHDELPVSPEPVEHEQYEKHDLSPVSAPAPVPSVPAASSHSHDEMTKHQPGAAPSPTRISQIDGLVLTTGTNDLGFEEESDRSSDDEEANFGEWTPESFNHEDEAKESEFVDEDNLPVTRKKASSSVAMLGHYSIQTTPDAIPILPDSEEATGIGLVDNVQQTYSAPDRQTPSPVGYPIQPADMHRQAPASPVHDDAPRESVRMTMDGGAAPMMKSHPIGTLHELCSKGNLRGLVHYFRANGTDELINREPNHGQTGLHLAVKSGNVQAVKLILDQYKPIDELINIEDDKGNTALHFAATKKPAMVHILLESGASANVKNSRKLTPLIISIITARADDVITPRMLLKYGANPNDMHDSQTVIHTAIANRMLQIAGALVRAGAKMDVEDAEGKNVFEKLNRASTRFLITHVYFPPTYITEKERSDCMLCHKKFKFGHRKYNCTHCGRLACADCAAVFVQMVKFPMGFPGRIHRGAANREQKRVCKTCFNVFKERDEKGEKPQESKFMNRIIGVEWDEVNPNKLEESRPAGRRGEKS